MKKIVVLFVLTALASGCFGHRVPRAKSDAEFTYKIGWWPHQENLTVESLKTEVVDSSLYLFNSKSLIRIRIKGTMRGPKGWEPTIKQVHIVEEVIVGGNFTNSLAEIRLKPIVGVKKANAYAGDSLPYDLTQELHIHSMGWGSNTYRIVCGGTTNVLNLMQMK